MNLTLLTFNMVRDFRHAESLTLNYGQQFLENVKEVLEEEVL